jgi:hypothetical protein
MLLTRIGTVIAHLMFWGGLFGFAVAVIAAINPHSPSKPLISLS